MLRASGPQLHFGNIIMNNIKLFRLINGEEIVAEVETNSMLSSTPGTYTIKNPCAIGLVPTAGGQVTMNMQPWLIFTDTKLVTIKEEHILFSTGVDIKIQNKYNEIFGSGIIIAQHQPITR